MKKQIVHIFGDSYAESTENRRHHLFKYSWPAKLETVFNVKNHAVGGSGPQDVCTDLHTLIQNTDRETLKHSIAIIVLPDISRYNFAFYQKRNHSVFGQLNNNHTHNHFFVNEFLAHYNQDKLKFVLNFRQYYLEHAANWAIEEAKYLSYFNTVAEFFKQTLVWPVSPLLTTYQYQKIDLVSVALESIATHEQQENVGFGRDNRLNHVSMANHNAIAEQLYNWIVDKTPVVDVFLKD